MKAETVVVGIDGSPNARKALEAAIDLVSDTGVVHIVTAFHSQSPGETNQALAALPDEFKTTYDALAAPRAHLRDAEALVAVGGHNVQAHLVEDHPAAAILDVADQVDADMIVVGSRGLTRGTRFLRGSVSSRVAAHATTSFMVIHHADHAAS